MEDVKLLRKMRLFSGLTTMELVQVSKLVKHRKARAGQIILEEGSLGGSLFVIKKGELKVTRRTGNRRRQLGTFRQGDHFGEISLVDHRPRSATIRASADCDLLEIDGESFEKLLQIDPKLQIKLLRALLEDLCSKLRLTNDVIVLTD